MGALSLVDGRRRRDSRDAAAPAPDRLPAQRRRHSGRSRPVNLYHPVLYHFPGSRSDSGKPREIPGMSNQETQTGAAAAAILLRSAPLEEQRHFGKLEREEEGADGHGMGES